MGTRVAPPQQMRHVYTHCHFNTLQRIQGQQAQLFIKHIQPNHVFKAAAGHKGVEPHSLI